jgi:L-ascorbate peroxidase
VSDAVLNKIGQVTEAASPAAAREREVREYLIELMPLEHAPAHLRMAFHDAGTFDASTGSGGLHGAIRLTDVVRRSENTGWGQECLALLEMAREQFPEVGWADLIAIGAAAAVQKTGGPVIEVGFGRTDATEPSPVHKLPGGYEDARLIRRIFARMGLDVRDLAALSGAHTLGHLQRLTFTPDTYVFSNSYYRELLGQVRGILRLNTDDALLQDPELMYYVTLYAADQAAFFADFSAALRKLTWLGNEQPAQA